MPSSQEHSVLELTIPNRLPSQRSSEGLVRVYSCLPGLEDSF